MDNIKLVRLTTFESMDVNGHLGIPILEPDELGIYIHRAKRLRYREVRIKEIRYRYPGTKVTLYRSKGDPCREQTNLIHALTYNSIHKQRTFAAANLIQLPCKVVQLYSNYN